jgi:hypothetical protein
LNLLKVFNNMAAVQTCFPIDPKPLEDYREDVFRNLFVDPYDKIYRGEVDEKRIQSFFKEYFALSRRSEKVPTSFQQAAAYSLVPKKQKQYKMEVQKAIFLFKKLFYSSKLYKLHLSSLKHPATVHEILTTARPLLAGYDTLTADATGDSLRVTQESMSHTPTEEDEKDQKQEKICWYQTFTFCYHQEKPEDQMLVGSLMALLAAIAILAEERDESSILEKVMVSKKEVDESEGTVLRVNTHTASELAVLFAGVEVPKPIEQVEAEDKRFSINADKFNMSTSVPFDVLLADEFSASECTLPFVAPEDVSEHTEPTEQVEAEDKRFSINEDKFNLSTSVPFGVLLADELSASECALPFVAEAVSKPTERVEAEDEGLSTNEDEFTFHMSTSVPFEKMEEHM